MKTLDLVKTRIESEKMEPRMKRQMVSGKMTWILENPETKKWAVISETEMEELNEMFHVAKYGRSTSDDMFIFNS